MTDLEKDKIADPERIELHNPEMSDIMGDPPKWILHIGGYIFLGIIGLLMVCMFFYERPYIASYSVIIEDTCGVEWILAPSDGCIDTILFSDGQYINPGTTICLIINGNDSIPVKNRQGGALYIGQSWAVKRIVNVRDTISAVASQNNTYMEGRLYLSSFQLTDINKGDSALVEIEKYSAREFGHIIGSVGDILFVPSKNCYAVTINFKQPLCTTSGYYIDYDLKMNGIVSFSKKRKLFF